MWAREIQIKEYDTKPDELSLLPWNTHSGRRPWSLLSIPVISTHVPWRTTPSYTHTHKIHKCKKTWKVSWFTFLHSNTDSIWLGCSLIWVWFGSYCCFPFLSCILCSLGKTLRKWITIWNGIKGLLLPKPLQVFALFSEFHSVHRICDHTKLYCYLPIYLFRERLGFSLQDSYCTVGRAGPQKPHKQTSTLSFNRWNLQFSRLLFICLFLWDEVSCNPGWPWIPYVAKDDLEFLIRLLLPLKIIFMHHYTQKFFCF